MEDILLDENGRLQQANGDLVKGNSDVQHQRIILSCNKGSIRHAPSLGVGMADAILDENPDNLLIAIRKEFSKDGMTVNTMNLDRGKLQIDAAYENV